MHELRTLRKQTGLSLSGFAIAHTIEPSLLSLLERGKRPSRKTADRLAVALGTTPEKIWPDYESFRGEGGAQ